MTLLKSSIEAAGTRWMPQGVEGRAPSIVAVDILRRTALDLASTPGGLRVTARNRAWLQGLSDTPEACGLSCKQSFTGKIA